MKIILATRNKRKLEEMRRMCSGLNIEILSLDSFPDLPVVKEDRRTFRGNALKKALHVFRNTGYPAVADDSGLEVKALGGAPGVFSARYAGEKASDQDNVRKLLGEMKYLKDEDRKARFVCVVAFVLSEKKAKTFTGYVQGVIGERRKGKKGFGYDPVFYPYGHDRTFAEMTDSEKDALSHRGVAMRKLIDFIGEN